MARVANEQRLPFDVKELGATIRKAITELEGGNGKRFQTIDNLS